MSLKEKKIETQIMHTGKTILRHKEKIVIWKLREASEEPTLMTPLSWTSEPPQM